MSLMLAYSCVFLTVYRFIELNYDICISFIIKKFIIQFLC